MGQYTQAIHPVTKQGLMEGVEHGFYQRDADKLIIRAAGQQQNQQKIISRKQMMETMSFSNSDFQDAYGPGSIVSAKGLRMRESMNTMKYSLRAEIAAPEGWEPDPRSIWTPPSREFNDAGALKLWLDQMFLDNASYTRDQVVLYEITYEVVESV